MERFPLALKQIKEDISLLLEEDLNEVDLILRSALEEQGLY